MREQLKMNVPADTTPTERTGAFTVGAANGRPVRFNPEQSEYILFIDLETLGTEVNYHPPIEVGVAIMRRSTLEIAYGERFCVHLEEDADMPKVVRDMHTKNGLLEDCYRSVLTIEDVDLFLSRILDGLMDGKHIPFAGSGVLHFDRKFIDRWMPLLSKRITYWAYDVGVVRRFSQWAGGKVLDGTKSHRALDDALWHAQEAAFYMQLLKVGSKYYDEGS